MRVFFVFSDGTLDFFPSHHPRKLGKSLVFRHKAIRIVLEQGRVLLSLILLSEEVRRGPAKIVEMKIPTYLIVYLSIAL
jgi:hypothetical protein